MEIYHKFIIIIRLNLFIFLTLFSFSAKSYEGFFEYTHFDGSKDPEFVHPLLFNIEYQSNLISYGNDPGDIYDFIRYKTVMFLSGGSANRHHLLLDSRVKFTKDLALNDSISFFFQKKKDYEDNSDLSVFEYRHHYSNFFLGIYIDPAFFKPSISVGLNLNYQTDNFLFRLFATKVDIFRVIRPDLYPDPDPLGSYNYYDDEKGPVTLGFVNRVWSTDIDKNAPSQYESWDHFLEYGVKFDLPTYWRFITNNYLYTYEKTNAFLNAGYNISDYSLFLGVDYSQKNENYSILDTIKSDKAFFHGNLKTIKYENKFEVKTPSYNSFLSLYLTLGFDFVYRNWQTENSNLKLVNYVLYSSLNLPIDYVTKKFWVSLMFLEDWHRTQGAWNETRPSSVDSSYKIIGNEELTRFNLEFKYYWPNDSRLSVLTSISLTESESIYGGTNLKYEYFL